MRMSSPWSANLHARHSRSDRRMIGGDNGLAWEGWRNVLANMEASAGQQLGCGRAKALEQFVQAFLLVRAD